MKNSASKIQIQILKWGNKCYTYDQMYDKSRKKVLRKIGPEVNHKIHINHQQS